MGFGIKKKNPGAINRLDLAAAFWALKTFASELHNCEILLQIDNTTAIEYINKMGGIQHPHLHSLSREIWIWCESKKLWIYASYIALKANVDTDRESRIRNVDTEWKLADNTFQEILQTSPNSTIDLFASNSNTKCNSFCSWICHPDAEAFDAFMISWKSRPFYAFPPFSMILRTLQKIISDEASSIVVVPWWTSQPWFPIFQSRLIGKPLIFSPSLILLLSPCRSRQHPLARSLTLATGWLSEKAIDKRIYRNRY